ncbi:MAG: bifunctional 4-hydroxy-2-oxoglutarate aldolase/2-dehydro-3-deoxy-phosphogluconate aldolase [Pseudomonadota bacterium]
MNILEICSLSPVIPVLVVENPDHSEALAKALFKGGLRVFEVTLRTDSALEVIERMRAATPEAIVGVGTAMTSEDLSASKQAGAQFAVAPGSTPHLLEAAQYHELPMLPGVATPSEAMVARETGCEVLKFFPAESNGGVSALKAWASPLAGISFCPTGGITAQSAASYLELPNVTCVGGSWITPAGLMKAENWEEVSRLAGQASMLSE